MGERWRAFHLVESTIYNTQASNVVQSNKAVPYATVINPSHKKQHFTQDKQASSILI